MIIGDNHRTVPCVAIGNKTRIKAHAEKQGESLNKFLKRAIEETIERDNEG